MAEDRIDIVFAPGPARLLAGVPEARRPVFADHRFYGQPSYTFSAEELLNWITRAPHAPTTAAPFNQQHR